MHTMLTRKVHPKHCGEWIGMQQTPWNAGLNIQEINKTKNLMQFVGLLNLW